MKFNALGLIIASSIALSGCIINISNATPTHNEQKVLHLDADNLKWLHAKVGAGELSIKGVRGQKNVQVEADIHSYDNDDYTLTLEKNGDQAKLVAEFDSSFNFNRSPYINLVVTVPEDLALNINDGSGPIDVREVDADIQISDGSGDINIIGGHNIDIQDGSGSIVVDNPNNHVEIADGSGDIDIKGGQNIEINDGSGNIDVRDSHGDLDINDGSGSINIKQVDGDLDINDGSGAINVNNIDGKVKIHDGSGSINVKYAKGLKVVNSGSGSLNFKHIDGPVSVDD